MKKESLVHKSAANCLAYLIKLHFDPLDKSIIENVVQEFGETDSNIISKSGDKLGLNFSYRNLEAIDGQSLHSNPIIVRRNDGRHSLLVRFDDKFAVLLNPITNQTRSISKDRFLRNWSESGAQCSEPIREGNQANSKSASLKNLILQFQNMKWQYATLLISSVLINLFSLSVPVIFLLVIDKVVVAKGVTTLEVLIISFLLIAIFEAALTASRSYALQRAARSIDHVLVTNFVKKYLDMPLSYYNEINKSELILRIRDVRKSRQFISNFLVFNIVDFIFLILFFVLIFNFNPHLGYIVLFSIPFYVLVAVMVTPRLRNVIRESGNARRMQGEIMSDAFTGIKTVKSSNAELRFRESIVASLAELDGSDGPQDIRRYAERYNSVIGRITVALILWIGAQSVIQGEMTLGQFVAAYLINRLMARPLSRITEAVYDYQSFRLATGSVKDFWAAATEAEQGDHIRVSGLKGHIVFSNVTFSYPGSTTSAIRAASFEIFPGEKIGLVGPSGSGKSTILNLIQKFYVAETGLITLDGLDIRTLDPHSIREGLGSIEQDYPIFSASVSENIALRRTDAREDIQGIVAAAQLAGAHEFISKLPAGYRSQLGTRGTVLSGGQRQRIALARAIWGDPNILLFDEATSSLDHNTEFSLLERMSEFWSEKTVIIVAHRLSALAGVDRIITLENGTVTECGSPEQLARNDGYFASMLQQQFNMVNRFSAN